MLLLSFQSEICSNEGRKCAECPIAEMPCAAGGCRGRAKERGRLRSAACVCTARGRRCDASCAPPGSLGPAVAVRHAQPPASTAPLARELTCWAPSPGATPLLYHHLSCRPGARRSRLHLPTLEQTQVLGSSSLLLKYSG